MTEKHHYNVNLKTTGERKGILTSPELPDSIQVATPPEFPKGIPGIWSPEHLLVAAVNSCLMTTFLAVAENSKLEYVSFECEAVGFVEKVEGKYLLTEIILKPKLVIPASQHADRAKRIIEMSEKACLISNSIKSKIILEPTIEVK